MVGSAERIELEVLDTVQVHSDIRDVSREGDPRAICRDPDHLGDVGAVEQERVGAALALDDVAAVPGIPDERVIAGTELRRVGAAASGDHIIAVAADQCVVAIAAGDRVVAGAAVQCEVDERGETIPCGDDIVAAIGIDDEVVGGADIQGEGRRSDPIEADPRAIGRDRERFGAVAAIDLGGIDPVAALEQVAAVTRVPDHAVIAGAAKDLVVAGPADQHVVPSAPKQQVVAAFAIQGVVAGLAKELIVPRAAGQDVVSAAPEEVGGRQCAVCLVQRDRIVAILAEQLNGARVGDGGGTADDRHSAAVEQDFTRGITAGRNRIVKRVA